MARAVLILWLAALLSPAYAQEAAEALEVPQLEVEIPGKTPGKAPPTPTEAELDLAAREVVLQLLHADLEARLDELAALRSKVVALLSPENSKTDEDVQRLIDLYASMKPKKAAVVLERLPATLAADVLGAMRTRSAGKILDSMNPDRAVRISGLMAGQK